MKTTRFGKLPPQYTFILNPYADARFTRCPGCNQKTKQRKLPLFIHVDPMDPVQDLPLLSRLRPADRPSGRDRGAAGRHVRRAQSLGHRQRLSGAGHGGTGRVARRRETAQGHPGYAGTPSRLQGSTHRSGAAWRMVPGRYGPFRVAAPRTRPSEYTVAKTDPTA